MSRALVLILVCLAPAVAAQPLSPGTQHDPAIPTLEDVVGHAPGEEITAPEEIGAYLRALAGAAPDRTRLVTYAESWEGRPLHLLIVGSAERIARLDAIRTGMQRLADPRGLTPEDASRLLDDLPVITWLLHGVHGNEASSADAALAEAYHLLAARQDPAVDLILGESLVLIDPMQNPDGRARFLYQHLLGRAAEPDSEPLSAEHDEPWPGGRSNHYLFDLNRDYFALSQPETHGRARIFLEWFPHVVVDLHEMGGNGTYYFAPPADPLNPFITGAQQKWLEAFGRQNAQVFDARGFAYFIREVYDSFYPGYGESWPIFHGAVGMTYEQASARGLTFRREDETILAYRDGVLHHFTAAITTAETAARNRRAILEDFLDYRRSAVREGEEGSVRAYVVSGEGDGARARRLAELLVRQGIEVRQTTAAASIGGRTVKEGAFVVPLGQPAGRLARNLLDPHVSMDEAFVAEQARRREKRLPDQIYDVTSWSLPLAFDVEVLPVAQPIGSTVPFRPDQPGQAAPLGPAQVAYLLPWSSGTAAAVAEALQAGIRVRSAGKGFRLDGRDFAAGTAIVRTNENEATQLESLEQIVAARGAAAVATDTGWVEDGISLGSGQVVPLKPPRVVLLWDLPAQSLSAGWARYVLERRFGQPVTVVRSRTLARLDPDRYDVLVLPSGDYAESFDDEAVKRLRDWMRGGGTLITLGEASRWAAGSKARLLETYTELRDGRPEHEEPKEPDAESGDEAFDYDAAIQPLRERPVATPGAQLRVGLDTEHWLAAGTDGEIQAIVEGQRIFRPIRLDKGRNVGVYAAAERLVASGLVWDEAKAQLANKAYLIHQPVGAGHLIAFAEDPNYRAFTEATELLFINAVLLGPAY